MIKDLTDVYQYKKDLKKVIIKYRPKFRLILREETRPNKKREIEGMEFK
ncbi:MAG: hypothetical protein ACFFDH_07845 [Promethearchaeota archaeon]